MTNKRKRSTRKSRKPKGKRTKTSIKKIVSRMMNKKTETKSLITVSNETDCYTLTSPSTDNVAALNKPNIGSNPYDRVGDRINGTYLDIRGSVMNNTLTPIIFKFMVIEHRDGDDPRNDLLESNSGVFGPPNQDLSALYARVNTAKYKVLGSKMITTGGSAGYLSTKLFHFGIPLKNRTYIWRNGGAVPERKIAIIYFCRRADNDEDVTNTRTEVTWNAKFYFKDF